MIERTIIVSIDGHEMEIPYYTFDEEQTEDEIYEAAVNYIMSSIDIEVI